MGLVVDRVTQENPSAFGTSLWKGGNIEYKFLEELMGLRENSLYFPYSPALVARAKEMRKNMTLAERKLWFEYLQPFPLKVYRQRPIDHYIVDFFCPKLKLVIEIDGDTHFTDKAKEYDQIRSEVLEGYGLTVIRFTNDEVFHDFSEVCAAIEEQIPF